MSIEYRDLIEWADTIHTERAPDFIDKWLALQEDPSQAVDQLALFLARSFVEGAVSFDIANTIFNQTMPVIGFDEAPPTFWQFYAAFEDYEHLDSPAVQAHQRIKSELSAINEI